MSETINTIKYLLYEMYAERGTGRTTNMIKTALLYNGDSYLVFPTREMAKHFFIETDRWFKCESNPFLLSFRRRGRDIRFISITRHNEYALYQAYSPESKIFFDHTCIERDLAELLKKYSKDGGS